MEKCIPSNPDISGIGVRAAIYAQNLLSFVPATSAIWDGVVTGRELDQVKNHSTTILLTAFGILISAVIQALNGSLTNYHATIVLSLSWMNNTNAFVYLLLFLQYDGSNFTSWRTSLGWAKKLLGGNNESNRDLLPFYRSGDSRSPTRIQRLRKFLARDSRRYTVLVLGSIHLTLMSAIGILLWTSPRSFGMALDCDMSVSIIGQLVPFDSQALQIVSLLFYVLFLVPGLNVILPALFGVILFVLFNKLERHNRERTGNTLEQKVTFSLAPVVIGLLLLLAINLIFLFDIELTLHHNVWNQDDGEYSWTFGQTLALLLLYAPLFQLVLTVLDNVTIDYVLRRELKKKEQELKKTHTTECPQKSALGKQYEEKMREKQFIRLAVFQDVLVSENFELLEALLSPDIFLISHGGRLGTAVQLAAYHGRLDLVKQMFHRIDQSQKNDALMGMALHDAAHRGHLDVVKYLVRQGADIDHISDGEYGTALQAASYSGEVKVVRYLLDHYPSANVNAKGGRYGIALQAASYTGAVYVIKLLLENQADVHVQGGEHGTALHAAAAQRLLHIVQILIDNGADVNNDGGVLGQRALHLAAENGHLEMVEYLLGKEVDLNALDGISRSALWIASWKNHHKVASILLTHAANPSINGPDGLTALHLACLKRHLEIVRLLLEKDALVDAKEYDGWTPLNLASKDGHLELVKLLIEKGASVRAKANCGLNSLHLASQYGHQEVVKLLLQKCATVDARSNGGWTPLHISSHNGHLEVVKVLLKNGADIKLKTKDSQTALEIASKLDCLDVFKFLQDFEANIE